MFNINKLLSMIVTIVVMFMAVVAISSPAVAAGCVACHELSHDGLLSDSNMPNDRTLVIASMPTTEEFSYGVQSVGAASLPNGDGINMSIATAADYSGERTTSYRPVDGDYSGTNKTKLYAGTYSRIPDH